MTYSKQFSYSQAGILQGAALPADGRAAMPRIEKRKEIKKMLDLIVKNGTVFNADAAMACDVGVRNGKIVELGDSSLWGGAGKIVDASGKYVMPGMLDSHIHIASPGPFPSLDNYHNGTVAAAYGGTTCIIDFTFLCEGETPRMAMNRKLKEAEGNSVLDYTFHPCITSADEQSFQEIGEMMDEGFPAVKVFTVYRNSLMLEAAGVHRILQMAAERDALVMVHAEHNEMIEYIAKRDRESGHTAAKYHPASRPVVTELTAYADVIEMARETKAAVEFAHVTTGEIESLIKQAGQNGVKVYVETCPHYLTLSDEVYEREDGCKYVCNPPVRSEKERESLWKLVENGKVSVINSDHTDFSYAQKLVYKDDYSRIPGGLPTAETRGMVLFSEGVVKKRISMERFVEVTSANVAKLMGLYPKKGVIRPGSDADITVIDPARKYRNSRKDMHMQTDYSPYEGMELTGAVTDTIVRGNLIIENGAYRDTGFRGKLLKCKRPVLD